MDTDGTDGVVRSGASEVRLKRGVWIEKSTRIWTGPVALG